MDIDRAKAARFSLNIKDIQDIVQSAVGGMDITETIENRERYPVNLRYPRANRDSFSALQALPIITPAGAPIALSAVTKV